jgi:hypothetical protein
MWKGEDAPGKTTSDGFLRFDTITCRDIRARMPVFSVSVRDFALELGMFQPAMCLLKLLLPRLQLLHQWLP